MLLSTVTARRAAPGGDAKASIASDSITSGWISDGVSIDAPLLRADQLPRRSMKEQVWDSGVPCSRRFYTPLPRWSQPYRCGPSGRVGTSLSMDISLPKI